MEGTRGASTVSFWGRRKVNQGVDRPIAEEIGQVMPQLIGVTDYELNASGEWLFTHHAETGQTVMTRVPSRVERITVDPEQPSRRLAQES